MKKIIKEFKIPNWFEAELVRSINMLCCDLKLAERCTTLKDDGLHKVIGNLFNKVERGSLKPFDVLVFKEAIGSMQDYLWQKFRLIDDYKSLKTNYSLEVDYDKGKIYALEKRKEDGEDDILKRILSALKEGRVRVETVNINSKPDSVGSLPLPDDMPVNIEGEEDSISKLRELFNNTNKGNLNKK
jgi:hypothetical protein